MKRFFYYCVFFFISGLIHLFLCVDLLHLKNYVPQWDASHLLEKVKTLQSQIASTPDSTPNSLPSLSSTTEIENHTLEKNKLQEENISELLHPPELFPTPTPDQNPPKNTTLLSHKGEEPEINATETILVLASGKASISTTNFLEIAKNDAFRQAIENALEQLLFSPPYPQHIFQDPFLYIQNYSVLEVEEQPEFCVVKMRVLLHSPSLKEGILQASKSTQNTASTEKDSLHAELESTPTPQKIKTRDAYEAHLKNWMGNFLPPENIPALRLVSESTVFDLYRREQTQGYRLICFPQENPKYFVTIRIDAQGKVSYEKREDTYILQQHYSRRYLRENIPLFQRFKAEIGSNPALYHPKDGPLLVVHLIPKERESYLLFKQSLAAKQCGLKLEEVQVLVGSFKETAFGEDVLILSGILTKSGEKFYPKDPELELLEFK